MLDDAEARELPDDLSALFDGDGQDDVADDAVRQALNAGQTIRWRGQGYSVRVTAPVSSGVWPRVPSPDLTISSKGNPGRVQNWNPARMTSRLDHPCVLPGIPSWLHDVRILDTMMLPQLADAAEDENETGCSAGLPDAAYRAAADAINNLATALPHTPAGSPAAGLGVTSDAVFLRAVPAWETEALWQVHIALKQAQGGEPDASGLGDLLQEVGEGCHPPQAAADVVGRLNRVLAVLLLDIPAVRTLATALVLDTPQDTHIQTAYAQIHAAWATVGIH